ncbi:MAG: murein transglycosylase [Alphaproteobacteria bacterium]|nr:murein transglycosylase [Alphaproteobacteria bacterium]
MTRRPVPILALLIQVPVVCAVPFGAWARLESRESGAATDPCAGPIGAAESRHAIPRGLLQAISLAESGRYDPARSATAAWPWTINAEGDGKYFPSKREAVAFARGLQKRGVASVDVGCMQISLRHHKDAFADLDQAFDPTANVGYAAQFLVSLYEETRSWSQAVAFYHSRTPEAHVPYRSKVLQIWGETQRQAAAVLRQQPVGLHQKLAQWQLEQRATQQRRWEDQRQRFQAFNDRPAGWQPARESHRVIRP